MKGNKETTASSPVVARTQDDTVLLKAIKSKDFLRYPSRLEPLLDAVPVQTANDGIEHAFHVSVIPDMVALLHERGYNAMPLRCILSRYDWDLIHNFLVAKTDWQNDQNAEVAAIARLIAKVHQQRVWCNKIELQQPGGK